MRYRQVLRECTIIYSYIVLAEGGQGPTLLLTEFTHIYERFPNDFRDNFSDPARDQMKHYGAHPNISICKYQAGWPPEANKFGQASYDRREQQHERMARSIKQSWVSDGSFISVSTFPSMEAVEAYHRDGKFTTQWRTQRGDMGVK